MAGKRPVAPTFGELAAGLVSGKRQGERDYLQEELAKTELVTLDNGDLATYNKITKEFDVLQKGTVKAVAPKSYLHRETGEKRSMTPKEYAELEDRENWLPFTAELGGEDIDPTAARAFETEIAKNTSTDLNLVALNELLADDKAFTAVLPKTLNNALTSIRANIEQGMQFFRDDDETQETTGIEIIDSNRDRITEIAAKSGMAEALIIVSAYSLANTLNPDGRISDRDFKYALQSLVGKTGDKNAMRAIVSDHIRMNRNRAKQKIHQANLFNRNPRGVTFESLFQPYDDVTIETETETSVPDDYDELGIL